MTRRKALTILILVTVIGSFITFYVSNLIFSDVGNMFYGAHDFYFIASIPGFMIVPDIVLLSIFTVRRYIKPAHRKKLAGLYSILLAVFSLIGAAASVLTGTMIYHSFVSPYPFRGYTLIALVFHVCLLVLGIILHIRSKKYPADVAKQKMSFKYVIYTAVIAILVFLSFNRLGALLWMPVYVHWRTLYMTFPFYLSLLLPIMLLINNVGFLFGLFDKVSSRRIWNICIILFLNVILGAATVMIGTANTSFISVISPALALERLATLPVDIILQFGLVLIFGVLFLVASLRKVQRPDRAKHGIF